jgi:hypothetical protein
MRKIDKRGRLADGDFSCTVTKDGRVLLYWRGGIVKTLSGAAAQKFSQALDQCESETCEQLLMAKATGHFKHGNERRQGSRSDAG